MVPRSIQFSGKLLGNFLDLSLLLSVNKLLIAVVATKLSSMARYGDVSDYVAFDLDKYSRSRLGTFGNTYVRNYNSFLFLVIACILPQQY